MNNRPTLTVGSLAYFDSLRSGLVPCKVLAITPGATSVQTDIEFRVTADRYAYPRGTRSTSNGMHVVPRKAIRRTKTYSYILPYAIEGVSK